MAATAQDRLHHVRLVAESAGVVVVEYEYTIDLADNKVLGPGTYWVGITNDTSGSTESWFWETGDLDPGLGVLGQAWNTASTNGPWNSDPTFDMSLEIVCKPHVAIPTVSEWGMIAMGLLLFSVATIVIRRRRSIMRTA